MDGSFRYTVQKPTMHRARMISEEVIRGFLEREVDEVHIIYTQMQNAVVMEPVNMQLLPLKKTSFSPLEMPAEVHQEEIEMFPSADGVLDIMIPNYLTGVIYGCLVEAYASEHNARMTAMQSSTDSAKEKCFRICRFSITGHVRQRSHRRSQRFVAVQRPRKGSDENE